MNELQKITNIIKSERDYDKSYNIDNISKWTENIIVETADKYNLDLEIAAEILINIGVNYIKEYEK